jgi:Clp amino terminal domain, pathogenicity island component
MFERFTTQARHVVVLAQEEARELDHNYIGTEHLLLGLLRETEGMAARALSELGLTVEMTRSRIVASVGRGKKPPRGHIPFTPRAKKVLEKALREAVGLRHNYIGTEHILLGLLKLDDGLSAILLREWNVDFAALRERVLALIAEATANKAAGLQTQPGPSASTGARRTTATIASLDTARRYAGGDPIGSHHLLLAVLDDEASAATMALAGLGLDVQAAREALLRAEVTGTSDELPELVGRRGMTLRWTDSAVVLEATDVRLLTAARLAFAAVEGSDGQTGVIPGDHHAAISLAEVWNALYDSLNDIRKRASTPVAAGDEDAPSPEAGHSVGGVEPTEAPGGDTDNGSSADEPPAG